MNSNQQHLRNPAISSPWQKANKAAGNYIGAVIDAFLCMLPISGPAALLAALSYTAAACQGLGVVVDSKRRKIAPAFRGVLFAPVTTCDQVSRHLVALLAAVESEIASAHVEKAAKHQARCLSHAEQSKTLEADLKETASQAALHSALLIALAAHDLKERRRPQTLRKAYSTTGAFMGVVPKKVGRRLLWPRDALMRLIEEGVQ